MFLNERPIEKKEDDKLNRYRFSSSLAKSILEWNGAGSLVLALNGKWGSGKSSVINLAKSDIEAAAEKAPTIIEFNPWLFSGDEKMNEHFFSEISKELKIRNTSPNDIKIANKFRMYSQLLNFIPTQSNAASTAKTILVITAILGLSAQQALQLLNLSIGHNILLPIISICLLSCSLITGLMNKMADFFDKRSAVNAKTVLSFKEEIKKFLQKRENKILIIIDDIDRLTPEEVRILFKLIKINSDFPNVIYLLSFDREVVKHALAVQKGIDGQDYLEKIVQVSFDIPYAKQEKINSMFIEECNRVLKKLPDSSESLFNERYWNSVYNSGLKNLFRNIRDVKRFSSSLEFNISLLFQGDSMEVNPIDFIAIEALRVFIPEFYSFMRVRKGLFTSQNDESRGIENSRKKELEAELNKIPIPMQDNIRGLISMLFPQVGKMLNVDRNLFDTFFTPQENATLLKVCSPDFYDAYFTLMPGGDESELSQFEIDNFLNTLNDKSALEVEVKVKNLITVNKLSQLLQRLENYTSDSQKITEGCMSNFVQVFFDISDELPRVKNGFFGFGLHTQFERVIYQMLRNNKNKANIFEGLKVAISSSKGLSGPVEFVDLQSPEKEKSNVEPLMSEDEVLVLQKICVDKIQVFSKSETFVANHDFVRILFRWKEWSNNNEWEFYFKDLIYTNTGLLVALKAFTSTMTVHGGEGVSKYNYFDYDSLDQFILSEDIKARLESIKDKEPALYEKNKIMIDLFINNFRADPHSLG